jgi:hypothetical protein
VALIWRIFFQAGRHAAARERKRGLLYLAADQDRNIEGKRGWIKEEEEEEGGKRRKKTTTGWFSA